MRLSLILVGEHNIEFNNREREDIILEIETCLNRIDLLNKDYHLEKALSRWSCDPIFHKPFSHNRKWQFRPAFVNSLGMLIENDTFSDGSPCYTFTGPYGLQFDITMSLIYLDVKYITYDEWFCPDILHARVAERNIWRTLSYQILNALSGGRMTCIGMYINDDTPSLTKEEIIEALEYQRVLKEVTGDDYEKFFNDEKEEFFLTEYLDINTFPEILVKLRKEHGPPAKTFEETGRNLYSSYFIDDFKDIRLNP